MTTEKIASPFKAVSLEGFDTLDKEAKLAVLNEIHPQLASMLGVDEQLTAAQILAKERALYAAK